MFLSGQTNQSEENAKFLIKTIEKSLHAGDLKKALRRIRRVGQMRGDKGIEKDTLGELLLAAAEVARAAGDNSQAADYVLEILAGNIGGLKMETLGRAKRLRARILLDEGRLDEAEVLAGTADRYIVTGLMEEKVETTAAGQQVRVNVPVAQKFLDHGQYVSLETYLLLAEIAAASGDWEKCGWNVSRAEEKFADGDRNSVARQAELALWRGIILMAEGQSFIQAVEPYLFDASASRVMIGRIEAAMGEERSEDAPINKTEYERFQQIRNFARTKADEKAESRIKDNQREITSEKFEGEIYDYSAIDFENSDNSKIQSPDDSASDILFDENITFQADLRKLSVMRLIETVSNDQVTGILEISWNTDAVSQGIDEKLIGGICRAGGKGLVYCQNGKFIDADIQPFDKEEIDSLPDDGKQKGTYLLKQFLLIALGSGSEYLHKLQSGGQIDESSDENPQVTALIRHQPEVANMEDVLQITGNVNFILTVSTELDNLRGGFAPADESADELDWDADWGTYGNDQKTQSEISAESSFTETEAEILSFEDAAPAGDERRVDEIQFGDEDDIDFAFESILSTEEKSSDKVEKDSVEEIDEISPGDVDVVDLPPWNTDSINESSETQSRIETATVGGEEIIEKLAKAKSWHRINESIATLFSRKFNCGISLSIQRLDEELSVSFGDNSEKFGADEDAGYKHETAIIEKIVWNFKCERDLNEGEQAFSENLLDVGKLKLLSVDQPEAAEELRSVGGVAIADDEWLEQFMVPPHSLVMRKKINEAQVYANQDGVALPKAHILLAGETGTGKDVFARLIHEMSARQKAKFVRADMGAVGGGDQFIATLFGAVKGSYTGQSGDRRGLVEEAEGGTLFLNEIGNLSLENQRALLDFMQEGVYTKLGDTKLKEANVRVILATNENINDAEKFRQDVKYRCAPPITLPPLRERREDIASLAKFFAGDKIILKESVIKLLEYQNWDGNVRELNAVIQASVATVGGDGEIEAGIVEQVLGSMNESKSAENLSFPVPPSGTDFSQALQAYEKFLLEYSLMITDNVKSHAAVLWGESPASITKKVKKWNLDG